MPRSVEDLLVKVQTVYTDLVLFALPTRADFARFQDRSWLAVLPRRLQGYVLPVASVKHPEEVVVGTGHHNAVVPIPTALKLVEDTIILIERTQFTPEIFMHLISLYWPGLHVEIPDFDRQVVAGHHVPTTVAELYIRDG